MSILIPDEYETTEDISKLTKVKYCLEISASEYVRNDTLLGVLLPSAYKFYYWLEWKIKKYIFAPIVRKLNQAGIMNTTIGSYPSWKDFNRR